MAVIGAAMAFLSASCCVLPMAVAMAGLGGSWLVLLGPLATYRGPILVGIGLALTWVWFRVMRQPGRPRLAPVALAGFGTLAFATALSAPLWEQELLRAMWTAWTAR